MFSFEELTKQFAQRFNTRHFPGTVPSLYEPAEYFLSMGGKRVRPVMCLMANELFGDIYPDAWHVADAIELFHNFTLIHDDIMDKATLRRGMQTVHAKYNEPTALLAGDVMMITSYECLSKINAPYLHKLMNIFNKTAKELCEGQQLDMDFEKRDNVTLEEYLHMITLKTSVLLAASLQMGAIIGGSGEGNQDLIYEFGKNLGIAFQVQDDYLDAFGDPQKFGKQPGGDILANKKTFLLIHALEVASASQKKELLGLISGNAPDKVAKTLQIFRDSKVDSWSKGLKDKYLDIALKHLDDIAVISSRKKPLQELAGFLVQREY
ncbi:polyprenyl synthetase [Terrimonas sp.]|uniref:polyprenyl synthetase family protein n=1 Tax=Terrimonas sp. TaxID=1914338 RepID=UPI000D511149|nr:polyprenyl synthetase family protein [Terrimonas sp.]PVD50563.1 polyprenyl synthetase [Terrimonas sp.]